MQNNTPSDNQILSSSTMVSIVEPIVIKPNNDHLERGITEIRDLLVSTIRRCESMPNIKVITTAGDGDTATVHAPAICLDKKFTGQSIRPWYSMPNISTNNNMITLSECEIKCPDQKFRVIRRLVTVLRPRLR